MKTILLTLLALGAAYGQRKFYPDDPLEKEPKPLNVESVRNRKLSDIYDLFHHQFNHPGEHQPKSGPPIRARAVNTLGEPMDGAWYTKRHYYRRMSIDELKKGPGTGTPPEGKTWTVVGAKSEGITAGFTVLDGRGTRYFIKFDPPTNPEMATAADAIGSRFFHALGYHVPDNFIVYFKPDQLALGEDVDLADKTGKKRKMTNRDLYEILGNVPKTKDGSIRATASLAIAGKSVGPPRYYGVRRDDPNDVVPHEHRREMRGLDIFCAWLDHDDSRAINNYDTLVKEGDVQYLKHYLLDFGSTLGSGSQRANSPRSGAYFFGWKTSGYQLVTLGLDPPYWARAHFEYYPAVGRIESRRFDPERWVPEYPNPAFLNRLPDDEFWAAKQVMAFTDEEIRALVSTGEISDPKAAAYLTRILIERRDKIGKVYFAKVLPFDRFRVENGQLQWDDLSASVKDAQVSWFRFNNETGEKTAAPALGSGGYWLAEISAASRPKQTISVYIRQDGEPRVIGIERNW